MELNIVIGGQAGQGPNAVARIVSKVLAKQGYFSFVSRDYGSFIRGGHNFNTIALSDNPIMSNKTEINLLIALDDATKAIHKQNLAKRAVVIECLEHGYDTNMHAAGKIIKILGIGFAPLEEELKKMKNFSQNLATALKGYNSEKPRFKLQPIQASIHVIDGSQAVAEGAIKAGLDIYYAYPMTPSTQVLGELAERQIKESSPFLVFEPESEIAAINLAIGSAATGAKAMIGTSGGGFDLMTEALSFSGMAEIPLVAYLAQRPGPGTGSATYTSQSDLNMARHSGHGEFQRVVLAPGDPIEAIETTTQAFYFSQKYKIPAIVLSDKHLAESIFTHPASEIPNITLSEKTTFLKRYNSYEHDKNGNFTDLPKDVKENAEARITKQKEIQAEALKFKMIKSYGNENAKNLILFWGSTKGAVLDSLKELKNIRAIQILYLDPFPSQQIKEAVEKSGAENVFIVENNSTSQLSQLIAEKTGIIISDENKVLKYDSRPFASDELTKDLRRKLK